MRFALPARGRPPTTWDAFFAAEVGASAALAGLLFVGVSINLQRIISLPLIANRALQALVLLVAVLAIASVLLVPGESGLLAGIVVLAIAVPLWLGLNGIELRNWAVVDRPRRLSLGSHTAQLQVPCALFVGGGVLLVVGNPWGLYWFPAAMVVTFLVTILETWVILVEINR